MICIDEWIAWFLVLVPVLGVVGAELLCWCLDQ
jgi:hypothetical protein